MNEFKLIDSLVRIFEGTGIDIDRNVVVVPNGDDAAVVRPVSGKVTLTTDTLVENVHFSFRFCSPEDVGYRAVAVNFSDIAAMASRPIGILVSLAVPPHIDDRCLLEAGTGVSDACARFSAPVLGGNVTKTAGPFSISITAVGDQSIFPPPLRSGALPGDEIWVSGCPGDAAAGLWLLENCPQLSARWPSLVQAYLRPWPRLDLVPALSDVHAAIDISDGLIADLRHVLESSGVGAVIEVDSIPFSCEAVDFFETVSKGQHSVSPMERALYGGDDYQLLVAADPSSSDMMSGAGFERIGSITKGPKLFMKTKDDLSGNEKLIEPDHEGGWLHRF